jgi:hypothetical protein
MSVLKQPFTFLRLAVPLAERAGVKAKPLGGQSKK